jgi:hypothetical protein
MEKKSGGHSSRLDAMKQSVRIAEIEKRPIQTGSESASGRLRRRLGTRLRGAAKNMRRSYALENRFSNEREKSDAASMVEFDRPIENRLMTEALKP